eukprot:gene9526-17270_t
MAPPPSQVEIEGVETDLPIHMNIAIMATLNVVRLTSRLLLPSKHGCRCSSSIAAQAKDVPKVQAKRKQKVVIVTEEEAAKLKKPANSHFVNLSEFDDDLVSKFVNCMMWDGKKALANNIMKSAFERVKEIQISKAQKSSDPETIELDPLKIFKTAVENSKPVIGCTTMKKGGKNYSSSSPSTLKTVCMPKYTCNTRTPFTRARVGSLFDIVNTQVMSMSDPKHAEPKNHKEPDKYTQVPTPLPESRRRFLAMKWIITAAREQNGPRDAKMHNKLAKEFIDAYYNEGTVIKKKTELHKVAEANRAFAHYRWW